ncbi:hypothetical protein [uncultured Marinobacter sp.]|uniref:phage tail tube protein n=1 Tax=uncultured Marinobacter sp. TaxID=187379 RepID=UPI0030DBA976|tara:strand:- start:15712 stop:16464 length:753 start_codon:yes stop_codon:yes gene_type:complete
MSYKDTGLIFAGNIYMAKMAGDNPTEFAGPINVTRLELTPPQPEEIVRTSFERDTFGQALDSVNLPGEAPRIAMDFDSLPSELLADALAGTVEGFDEAVKTATAEPVTLSNGMWMKLPLSHIDASSIVVTDPVGPTVLVRGDDYQIEAVTGLIRALNDTAAVAVTVDYDTLAAKGNRVLGATEISKKRQVIMDGVNLVTGKPAAVTVWAATFSATQAMDLMSREFVSGTLEGTMITPEGKTSPYEIDFVE